MTEKKVFWNDYHTLALWMKNYDDMIEVSNYMKDHDVIILVRTTNEEKSPSTGYEYRVYIEGQDLSVNGCCFSGSNLLHHVRYHRKIIEISMRESYKKYEHYRKEFEPIYRYLNPDWRHERNQLIIK